MGAFRRFSIAGTAAALAVSGLYGMAASSAAPAHHDKVPVLGSKKFAPNGDGWGHAHPKNIFNGGDPSGAAHDIRWKHWGAKRSYGHGKAATFKPGGGYYAKPVKIELRAQGLASCTAGNPAYTRLFYREAKKPGGKVVKHWSPWLSGNGNICDFLGE